jgi:hypothetical protein
MTTPAAEAASIAAAVEAAIAGATGKMPCLPAKARGPRANRPT